MPSLSPATPSLTWAGKWTSTPDTTRVPQHMNKEWSRQHRVTTCELQLKFIAVHCKGIQPSRGAQGHLWWGGNNMQGLGALSLDTPSAFGPHNP